MISKYMEYMMYLLYSHMCYSVLRLGLGFDSVEGTALYDNGDVRVIVTTSEISREEELPIERPLGAALPSTGGDAKKQHKVPVNKKKPFKRVAKTRPRRKQQKKRDIRKGKTINNKR